MNARRLLAHYERIADAPDAIARLRRFILDLAVRGKLVPQDPRDEPSPDFLKRIANEKLIHTDLPKGWRRSTVGRLVDFQYGKGLKASERASSGPVPVFGSNGIVGFTDEPLTIRPSIIVGRKGSAGALNACMGPSWTTDVAYFVEAPQFIDINFLLNSLAALNLANLGKGVKPGLSRSDAYALTICIPPLAEQRRIVAKVDELMALCDRLAAVRSEREATRDRLTSASLARLRAPDSKTFQDDIRFALEALPTLTTRTDQITRMRQTILNLAMRGKLVPQNTNDEPATELLKRIATEKARVTVGLSHRGQHAAVRERRDELGFSLPAGWALSTLGTVALKITDGAHQTPTYVTSGVPFVSVKDFSAGRLDLSNTRRIAEDEHRLLYRRCDPKRGDMLLGRIGTLGRAVLVDTDEEFSLFVSVGLIRFSHQNIAPDFFRLILNSPLIEGEFDRIKIGGATHTNKLNLGDLQTVALPIPPFAEQKRIAAKVGELMLLCDRLEASVIAGEVARHGLLDALLAEALAPPNVVMPYEPDRVVAHG